MTKRLSSRNRIDSISKASKVLDALSESSRELGVTDLSNKLGLSTSTTHRILDTLVDIGYVQRNPNTHRYRLGYGLFKIGLRLYKRYVVQPDVESILESLAHSTGETAKLGIFTGDSLIYLGVVESSNSLRFVSEVGESAPLHCTAMGKTFLAGLTEKEKSVLISRLEPFKQFTQKTITTSECLLDELENIFVNGYALDDEEYVDGSRGIAVPIIGSDKSISAAVSISGPAIRLSNEILLSHLPILKSTSEKLSTLIDF